MNKQSLQKLLSHTRRAITDFDMISDGDRIAVGLSGGKDSLTLLAVLKAYQRFSPQRFELCAVTVDMGFGADFSELKAYVAEIDVPYTIVPSEIAKVLFEIRKEKNPCSLCSKLRRGALNSAIIEMGYDKLALGHHADDLVETFMLSLIYEGRLSTFQPTSFMDRSGVTMIRPMIYLHERDIRSFSRDLPVLHNPCPADKHTQREYMKNLLKEIRTDIPFAFDRMHSAITNSDRNNLFPSKKIHASTNDNSNPQN